MHPERAGASEIDTERKLPPFKALGSRFLRRTFWATLVTLALVAMTAAAYGFPRWGGYYLAMGCWTLVFLSITPLILKAMMFDRQPLIGLLLIGAKVILLLLAFIALTRWSRSEPSVRVLGSALVAGAVTPLLVVVLRVLGGATEPPSEPKKPMEEGKP